MKYLCEYCGKHYEYDDMEIMTKWQQKCINCYTQSQKFWLSFIKLDNEDKEEEEEKKS